MSQVDIRILESLHCKRHTASADTVRKTMGWEIWQCNDHEFKYSYDRTVSLIVHEGAAELTFADKTKVSVQPGDFLTIEKGAQATWHITSPLTNRFQYHDTFESASKREAQVHWHDT